MNKLAVVAAGSGALLGATWLLYPLAIAATASMKRRRQRNAPASRRDPLPTVSVILATREDFFTVDGRVDDLLRGDYPQDRLEVVVAVDKAAADASVALLAETRDGVKVVNGDPEGGKAANLNAGVRAATGDVLVFADSYQRFEPSAIRHLVSGLAPPGIGFVSGRLELSEDQGARSIVELYWRYESWLRRNEAEVYSTIGGTGAICAMRRDLWRPLPLGLILDDVFTPMRVILHGWRVGYVKEAVAYETRRPTAGKEYRRKVRTLTGNLQLVAWLPEVIDPRRNPVWVQFVFHKLLRLLTPYLLIPVGATTVYAGVSLAAGQPKPVLISGFCAASGLLLLQPRLFRMALRTGYELLLMQAAVVTATLNALRGRWNVWSS